jgi:hypothetical protein
MKEKELVRIEVAGLVFSLTSAQDGSAIQLDNVYDSFLSTARPAVSVRMHYDGLPRLSLRRGDLRFDSESVWSLYRVERQYAIVLRSQFSGLPAYRIALFDEEVSQVEVYSEARRLPGGLLPDPLQYPLAEVLMVCLLARGRGLMMHACGIDDRGRGFLFTGNSTHGKTTTARLWREHATVLNDDRIVLRPREGRFWMYGTPWHGDYTGVSPQGVPLEKIFFLRHAEENRARRVAGAEAASMLLARCFPPFWDAAGMGFSLDFCAQLAEAVPCYELGFRPDERAVEYVRCVP